MGPKIILKHFLEKENAKMARIENEIFNHIWQEFKIKRGQDAFLDEMVVKLAKIKCRNISNAACFLFFVFVQFLTAGIMFFDEQWLSGLSPFVFGVSLAMVFLMQSHSSIEINSNYASLIGIRCAFTSLSERHNKIVSELEGNISEAIKKGLNLERENAMLRKHIDWMQSQKERGGQ